MGIIFFLVCVDGGVGLPRGTPAGPHFAGTSAEDFPRAGGFPFVPQIFFFFFFFFFIIIFLFLFFFLFLFWFVKGRRSIVDRVVTFCDFSVKEKKKREKKLTSPGTINYKKKNETRP